MPTSRSPSPAVVFIHGIGGSSRVWAPQMASFAAASFAPVALDLPGYGGLPPVEAMDFEGLAADVEAAIDKRGLNGPVLVGHSMGGMVAQTALRRRPRRLQCRRPRLYEPGLRQRRRRVPDQVRRRQVGAARCRQDHGRAGAQNGRPHDRAVRRSRGPRVCRRGDERGACGDLSRSGAVSGRLRRARKPRRRLPFPCFVSPARKTPMLRLRASSAWRARFQARATSVSPAWDTCPISRPRLHSMMLLSASCADALYATPT